MMRGLWREVSGRALQIAGAVASEAGWTRAGNRRRWLARVARHGSPVLHAVPALTGHMQAIPAMVPIRARR